jgi:hypothetical protein
MNELVRRTQPDAVSYIAMATALLAVGAIAVGAIAIGSMAIGRLAVQKVRLRNVEIDNLTVRRLRVLEHITPEPAVAPVTNGPTTTADATLETNGEVPPRPAPRRRRPRKPVPS